MKANHFGPVVSYLRLTVATLLLSITRWRPSRVDWCRRSRPTMWANVQMARLSARCLEACARIHTRSLFTVVSEEDMTVYSVSYIAVKEWNARGEVRRTWGDAGSTDSSAAERVGQVITPRRGHSPRTHVGLQRRSLLTVPIDLQWSKTHNIQTL